MRSTLEAEGVQNFTTRMKLLLKPSIPISDEPFGSHIRALSSIVLSYPVETSSFCFHERKGATKTYLICISIIDNFNAVLKYCPITPFY
jgi:hypothetical protein